MQDASSLAQTILQEPAPDWQQGGKAFALADCAGSVEDGNVHSLTPAIYRIGHQSSGEDGNSTKLVKQGHIIESVLSGQLSSRSKPRRESDSSTKEQSHRFRSQLSGPQVSVQA